MADTVWCRAWSCHVVGEYRRNKVNRRDFVGRTELENTGATASAGPTIPRDTRQQTRRRLFVRKVLPRCTFCVGSFSQRAPEARSSCSFRAVRTPCVRDSEGGKERHGGI